MRLAGHDEHGRFRVVAFEALTEVRLVQLDGHACLGTQYGRVSADALDDPLAHEERGLQAYSATLGAFAQAQTVHEAFEEPHPHARFELAHAHHPVRANAERPVAVHALPTLGAVTSTPFADDADAAAAHARLHLFRVARRRVQREPLVQGVAQRLDGKVALLRRQFAQFLPDPIGYTRHLARSHTTIVATQQLQYKSKSQPWSNRAKDYLRRVMNYRKMLVTQKVGDSFGALYNETRYGAAVKEGHDGIAFDKNKADTSLYGGFSSAKVVYSILVELKGKVRLVNITMQEYSMLGDCPSDEALKKVLVAKKPEYAKAKILLRHIPSMQLIHYKGACMTIKSATELNNARQLWLDCDVYNALDDYLKCGTSKSSIDIMQIWDALFDAVNKHYPLHRVEESTLAKARTKFEKLDLDKQLDVLGMIVVALHADPGRANLSLVGLPSEWKRVRSVSFSDDDEFVFQSPSGLFETKITIAELKKAE